MAPRVSIVILNYYHPEVIEKCLRTLTCTEGVEYEVIVVDNGSDEPTKQALRGFKAEGLIDTLVENPTNAMFSEGNNIGVRHSNPESEFILLLNSDVAFLGRPEWLTKVIGWMEGTTKYWPAIWDFKPTQPSPGPRDIVSVGWSHDANVVPGNARPEGWCLLIRRSVWQDMSPDFPWHYGLDEMIGKVVRAGAKCGVLFNYAPYLVHREGGSGKTKIEIQNKRVPDIAGWLSGIDIETLDFTLGPDEHDSYLCW
jgi:GT2 family glycosyltransferase